MTRTGIAAGDFILLGKITKPHGIRGEVNIYPYSGQPENFLQYREIFIGPGDDKEKIPYTIEQSRVQGKLVTLQISGCTNRSQAEDLVGMHVWLRRRDLPELKDGEYYWIDLVGKRVVTDDNREVGEVTGILGTGAHDILSVTADGHEHLIPLREEFVVRIDDHEIVLKLPPGLLEMNEN